MTMTHTRFHTNGDVPAQRLSLVSRMYLEARRNFLRQFVSPGFSLPLNITYPSGPEAALHQEIKYLKEEIERNEKEHFIVLLERAQSSDGKGISTTLAEHFAQLFQEQFKDGKDKPFVELTQNGIEFYWAGGQAQAKSFSDLLKAQGIVAICEKRALNEEVFSSNEKFLEEQQQALRDLYGNEGCYVTKILHPDAEKLLKLAQYHPYNLKKVLSDWYTAKKLNHAECVIRQAVAEEHKDDGENNSQHTAMAQRIYYDQQHDLVQVTVNTYVPKTQTPSHVIVLLDDSGSMAEMGGGKMKAANAALEKLIMETLSPETLVTIQPMNADTVAHRETVESIKQSVDKQKKYFSTTAQGGTPLCQLLVNSATLVRKSPQDLIIDEGTLNKTTVIVLTDGEDSTRGSVQHTVTAMQTSEGGLAAFMQNVKLPHQKNEEGFVAYGFGNFQCHQLPAVLPVSVGSEADVKFMGDLAEYLHAPEAYVRTDNENMQKDIDYALSLVTKMTSRIPGAHVGIQYKIDGQQHVATVTEHNLFDDSSRLVFFKIPHGATDIQIGVVAGEKFYVTVGDSELLGDEPSGKAVTDAYAEKRFFELYQDYQKKLMPVPWAGRGSRCGDRGDRELEQMLSAVRDEAKDESEDKEKIIAELQELVLKTTQDSLKTRIQRFIGILRDNQIHLHDNNSGLSREQIAQATQNRYLTPAVRMHVVPNSPAKKLCDVIKKLSVAVKEIEGKEVFRLFDEAVQLLQDNSGLVNSTNGNWYASTPLMYAIEILKEYKEKHGKECVPVRGLITNKLLACHDINLLAQDTNGNTALHRAAWHGNIGVCKAILKKAKEQGCLEQLIHIRNKNIVGATTVGETPLDNMRVGFLENQDLFKELHQLVHVSIDKNCLLDLVRNYPSSQEQLLIILADNTERSSEQEIIRLDESDFSGNTALHFAIQQKKFKVAESLLDYAQRTNQIVDVLAARNNIGLTKEGHGGQVPSMVLAEQGGMLAAQYTKALVERGITLDQEKEARIIPEEEKGEDSNNAAPARGVNDKKVQEKYEKFQAWYALAAKMRDLLDEKQKAEFDHFYTPYEEMLKGNGDPRTFLEVSPSRDFARLRTLCQKFQEVYRKTDPEFVTWLDLIIEFLKKDPGHLTKEQFQSIRNLLNQHDSHHQVVEEIEAHFDAAFCKQNHYLEKNKPFETVEEIFDRIASIAFDKLEPLKNACQMLKNVLAEQSIERKIQKKIAEKISLAVDVVGEAEHDPVVARRKLKTLEKIERELKEALVGEKIPRSSQVQAAIGAVFGALVGLLVIVLTGGIAAVPVTVIAVGGSAGFAGSVGFFKGRHEVAQYDEKYTNAIGGEPVKAAVQRVFNGSPGGLSFT
jgi:Mg-chelatase subunit ChlD